MNREPQDTRGRPRVEGSPPTEVSRLQDSAAASEGLHSLVARGIAWKFMSQVALQLTRFVVVIALARMLTPHQVGLAAMALVLSGFVISFADLGLGAALVQRREITEADLSTAFWTSVAAGAVLTGAIALAAPAIASFFRNADVAPLVRAISLTFFITSLGAVQRSLLVRAMDFRPLELRTVVSVVAGGAAAIAFAARGFGPWALIAQELTVAVVSTVLVWLVVPWRPKPHFSRRSLRELGGFGFRNLGGSFFTTLNQNTDNILVGRFIGSAPLGLYAFSYNLVLAPLARVVGPLQQVAFPAFSRLQDDESGKLESAWLRANRLMGAVCIPPLVAVIVTAPELVPMVFGSHWSPAARIVQILCWGGILQCLQPMNDAILQGANAVKRYLHYTVTSFAVNVTAFALGLHWGIIGVAAAFAIANTALTVAYTTLVAKTIGIAPRVVAASMRGIVEAVLGMLVPMLAVWAALEGTDPPIHIAATLAVGVPAYLFLLAWREPQVFRDVRALLRSRRTRILRATASVGGATS